MAESSVGFTNMAQWRSAMRQTGGAAQGIIKAAMPDIARDTRDMIRKRIPPGGSSGRFPGYASKGTLQRSIVASPVSGSATKVKATVGLARNASKLTKIKAYVHEYGMTIHAKRYTYMTFKIGGKWVRARKVRIRPKYFFRDGWAEARARFPTILEKYVKQRWPPRR